MGTKFTQLKTDLSQNNWLVFVAFLMYNFIFLLPRCIILLAGEKILISSFKLVFTCVFHLYGLVFS